MYHKRFIQWLALLGAALILLIGAASLHALASDIQQTDAPAAPAQQYTLSGRVYQGNTGTEPPTSKPLEGVAVSLYCSNNKNQQGSFLRSTHTDANGWYGLDAFDNDNCAYFNIVESNLSNYASKGATTVDGNVVTADWIQYDVTTTPLSDQTLTGNKFWDDLAVLSGRVYEGDTGLEPPNSSPIPNVTVSLYCSNNYATQGTFLRSTTTDSNGWYGLQLHADDVCEYFNVIETDPPGYVSDGDTTVDGDCITLNWIEFVAPITANSTGNKFWDRKESTPTPTPTAGPGTPTSTPIPTNTATPTVGPGTPTPTPLPTSTPTPTPAEATYTPTPARPTSTPTPGEPGTADLSISKTFSIPEPVAPGSYGYYRLRVENNGPATAHNVVITDTLPAEFAFDYGATQCTKVASRPPNDVIRCNVSYVTPGYPVELVLYGNVSNDAWGAMLNTAEVRSDTPDPNMHNNSTSLETVVGPCNRPSVSVRKRLVSPTSGMAAPGDTVTFAIDVFNTGNTTLDHIYLEDTFDSNLLSYVSASPLPSAFAAVPGSGIIKWADLTAAAPYGFGHPLASGGHFSLTVTLRAKQPGYGNNCADVDATAGGETLHGEGCDGVNIVGSEQGLVLRKRLISPVGGVAAVGQIVEFEIEMENWGTEPITSIHLQDLYDTAYLSFVDSATPPDDPTDDGTLDWGDLTAKFGHPLDPWSGFSFRIRFRAKQATAPGQVTKNCVKADYSHDQGPTLSTGQKCARVRINSESGPGVTIRKVLYDPAGGIAHPGDTVRFSFVISNTGTTTLTNVSLVDLYDTDCLHFVPTGWPSTWHLDPDDPTDDGHLDWSNYIALWPQMPPGAWQVTWPGVVFEAKAGSSCDPTINVVEAEAADNQGHKAYAADDEPVRILGGGVPTATSTPGVTPTPTATPTLGVTATPTPHTGGYLIYLPLVLKYAPIPIAFSDDFDDGDLAGWTPNHGTWTNPGDHMRGQYASGNAWNMRSEEGTNFVYEGTVNLLSGNAVGLTFRSSADGTSSYDVILDAVDNVFKISKRPPYTVLASYHMTVQRNHPYHIAVVAHGDEIEGYLDGVKRLTATDGTYSSGKFGVILFRATAAYDDLRAYHLP